MPTGLFRRELRRMAHEHIRETLLCWCGPEHDATHLLSPSRKRRRLSEGGWRRFLGGNVVGIGHGAKETAGAATGDLAVRIYVKRKLPRSQLPASDHVPPRANGILTDVVEVGTPMMHARPMQLGAEVSHARGGAGTLGCVVTRVGDPASYLLSASHVLAPPGLAQVGDAIMQPACADAGLPLATLTDFEPLQNGGAVNRLDGAIARINQAPGVAPDIAQIGFPQLPVMEPATYQSVRKIGSGSGHSVGIVMAPVNQISLMLGGESYLFQDLAEVDGAGGPFSAEGDSGALVVDAVSYRPIGLVIGGCGRRSFVIRIKFVLDRFGAQIPH